MASPLRALVEARHRLDAIETKLDHVIAAQAPPAPPPPPPPPPPPLNQIYAGYTTADVERLAALAIPSEPKPGFLTDFLGIRTSLDFFAFPAGHVPEAHGRLPVPDDGFHAEAIEYVSAADAVARAVKPRFVAVEVGAGWGPWIGVGGTLAKRAGFEDITLVGIEASAGRFAFMKRHLAENGLRPPTDDPVTSLDGVTCELIEAAGWSHDTTLSFPDVDARADHGAQVVIDASSHDYRGHAQRYRSVPAVSLPALLARLGRVDFLHIDVQGAESTLINGSLEALDAHVALMFVGTHSRKIEGDLIALLRSSEWRLLREKPCRFDPAIPAPSLEGLTTMDGGQCWINPRFG